MFETDVDAVVDAGWEIDLFATDHEWSKNAKRLLGHPGLQFSIRIIEDSADADCKLAYKWLVDVEQEMRSYASFHSQYGIELYSERDSDGLAAFLVATRPKRGQRGERWWDEGDWSLRTLPDGESYHPRHAGQREHAAVGTKMQLNEHWRFVHPRWSAPEKHAFEWYTFRFDWTLSQADASIFKLSTDVEQWQHMPDPVPTRMP